jgi:hypothetical protein
MENFIAKNWFKLIIGVAVLVASISIGYYFVIYLPGVNDAQIKTQQEAQQEASINQQAQKNAQAAALSDCLSLADSNYHLNWVAACKSHYNTCLSVGLPTSKSFCSKQWNPDPTLAWNCPLSIAESDSVTNIQTEAKNECFKQYPQQ